MENNMVLINIFLLVWVLRNLGPKFKTSKISNFLLKFFAINSEIINLILYCFISIDAEFEDE